MKIQRSTGDNGKKRECESINQGGTAGFRSLTGWIGVPPFVLYVIIVKLKNSKCAHSARNDFRTHERPKIVPDPRCTCGSKESTRLRLIPP